MPYVEHTWTNGETITAAKMNNIEEGIAEAAQSGGGGALIVNSSYSSAVGNYVLDKTAQEIYDALLSGTPVYIKFQYGVLDTDYIGTLYIAPVVKIYNYDYTNVIRVVAAKPVMAVVENNQQYFVPGCLIYGANGLNDYPVYVNSTMVHNASCVTTGIY